MRRSHCLAIVAVLGLSGTVRADQYESFGFTGQLSGGDANVQAPFSSVLTQGQSISGNFIADTTLTPGSNSGLVNVNFSSYPDIADIPSAQLFQISLGPIIFTASDAVPGSGAVQYNNGNFNGFAYTSDFTFQNTTYDFTISGGVFSISTLGNPSSQLVSGSINIGNSNLTDQGPFTPSPIPEPSTMVLLAIGTAGAIVFRLRQSRRHSGS